MRPHGTLAFLAATALALGALGARAQLRAPVAHAAQTWGVQVGADVDANNGITANAFFPNAVTIDAGDTVNWTFPSANPHTVTFDNGALPPLESGAPGGGRVLDPTAGSADVTKLFNPVNVSASNRAFDPAVQISSGVPQDPVDERAPFTLSFSQPGVYHFECAIHGAPMSGTVTVLPTGAGLAETPDQTTARGKGELDAAMATTTGFFRANPPRDAGAAATPSVHNVDAGVADGTGVQLLQFVNKDLTVHRGDTVVWTSAQETELHTVTFLSGGDEPAFLNITPQPGGLLKIVSPANVFSPVGGTTYTGQGYLNSGHINAGGSFAALIDAPPGTYQYVCLVHADDFNMKGTITVSQ